MRICFRIFGIFEILEKNGYFYYRVHILQYKSIAPILSEIVGNICEGLTNNFKMIPEFFQNF